MTPAPRIRAVTGAVTGAARTVPIGGLLLVPARVARYAGAQTLSSKNPFTPRDLPTAVTPTVALLAQVAVDELVLALLKRPDRFPTDAEIGRVGAELEQTLALYRQHGWDVDPHAYHQTPPALVAPEVTRERWLNIGFERLTWPSGFQPRTGLPNAERWLGHESNDTAHALVLRHDDSTRPWVVCLHGLGTGMPLTDLPGFRVRHLHRDLGFNVVLPVLPRHGPRGPGRLGAQTVLTYDHGEAVLAVAQAVWDVRRILSWIRDQGGERIAVHGISLGGLVAGMLAALDDDLRAVIAGIPVVDIPRLFRAHVPRHMRRRAWMAGLLGEGAAVVHAVISPTAAPPVVDRDRLYVYAGVGDRFVPPSQALRLSKHWKGCSTLWFPGDHIGASWSRPVRRFIDGALTERLAS